MPECGRSGKMANFRRWLGGQIWLSFRERLISERNPLKLCLNILFGYMHPLAHLLDMLVSLWIEIFKESSALCEFFLQGQLECMSTCCFQVARYALHLWNPSPYWSNPSFTGFWDFIRFYLALYILRYINSYLLPLLFFGDLLRDQEA